MECPFGHSWKFWKLDRQMVGYFHGQMVDSGQVESHGTSIWTDPTWPLDKGDLKGLSRVCPRVTEVYPQPERQAGRYRQTNCSQSWIFWFPFDVPNPKFAFSIAHIPLRDDEEGRSTVVKDVRKAFNSKPIYGHLLDHIAKYSDCFPEDFPKDPARRVRAFIRSVTASALTIKVRGKREEMVWRIYFKPPHSDPRSAPRPSGHLT
ncbi:hypothetical protein BKA70DRAFT_1220366 [Coprinopsis sp. MPI-PUGE-AT-0042]|nr:hypothetical protein BKA70DRAFT_1220366 [Coprinopsis sp. MPI-PUGE-AT-0042]